MVSGGEVVKVWMVLEDARGVDLFGPAKRLGETQSRWLDEPSSKYSPCKRAILYGCVRPFRIRVVLFTFHRREIRPNPIVVVEHTAIVFSQQQSDGIGSSLIRTRQRALS
jgi:hypothetical protein